MKLFEVSGSVANGFTYEIEAESDHEARVIAYDLAEAEFGTCDCFDVDEINLIEGDDED